MDQEIESEAPVDPAAVAFEALRREVALLNVALSGLAAERASAPDYSETLGEIAQGVRVAVARMGKLATSPALLLTPAEVARQITAASDDARRQDRAMLHQAQEMLQRAAGDLKGWVDTARLASVQNWRLLQAALAGVIGGAVLGASFPIIVAQAAPAQWAWPGTRAVPVASECRRWPSGSMPKDLNRAVDDYQSRRRGAGAMHTGNAEDQSGETLRNQTCRRSRAILE